MGRSMTMKKRYEKTARGPKRRLPTQQGEPLHLEHLPMPQAHSSTTLREQPEVFGHAPRLSPIHT